MGLTLDLYRSVIQPAVEEGDKSAALYYVCMEIVLKTSEDPKQYRDWWLVMSGDTTLASRIVYAQYTLVDGWSVVSDQTFTGGEFSDFKEAFDLLPVHGRWIGITGGDYDACLTALGLD